jgi:hypothetical protein
MRTSDRRSGSESGIALLATLLVVVLIAAVVAAAVNAAMTVTRSTNAEYYGTRAFYAAEAGAEHALAQVELALRDGFLSPDELADIEPPELEGFEFTEFEVIKEGVWDTASIKDGPFAGLYAITQHITVTSAATDVTGAHAGVVLGAEAHAIPMFQFAGFGNGAMEAYTGARSDTWGRVHVNGDIYMATSDHHIHTVMTTPGRFIRDGRTSHKDKSDINVFIELEDGSEVKVDFDSEDTPDPEAFKNRSELELDGRLRTGAMGVDSLTLPLPDSLGPHELIAPRRASDDAASRATKFSWQADMYVTIDFTDVRNLGTVCIPTPYGGKLPNITVERPHGGAVPGTADKCDIFTVRWETFFDTAELKWVDAVDVDIQELRDWVNENPSQNATSIIYVEIKNSSTITDPSETDKSGEGFYFPILRIKDGARLPGPLTIGSEYPLYMQGDYNDVDKQPAAVFGDRLTVLSNEWKDSENRVTYEPFRHADPTTQFFAVVTGEGEGYLGCYHHGPDPGCTPITNGCSPGVTVQMLEDWGWRACGSRCLHRLIGSFITFWYPQIASPYGDCPNPNPSYRAPERDWSFDPDLMNPANLPPGTPNVGYVLRASFREVY